MVDQERLGVDLTRAFERMGSAQYLEFRRVARELGLTVPIIPARWDGWKYLPLERRKELYQAWIKHRLTR